MKDEHENTTTGASAETTTAQDDVTEVVIVRDTPSSDDAAQTSTPTEGQDVANAKPSRKKRLAKILFTVLFIVVTAGIIAYTAVHDFSGENVSLEKVGEMIGDKWYYLLVLFGLFALTILSESFKFFLMIRKTTHTYRLGTSLKCAALGKFYDYITPFGSGGQPFQIYYLSKSGVPSGPAGAIPIGSMFLIQFSFFVCAIVSFIVGVSADVVPVYIQILAYFGSVCYIIVSLFLVVFSFIPKAGYKVISFGVKICTKLRICKNPEQWIAKGNKAIDNNKTNMGIIMQSKRVLIVGTLLSFVFNIAQCSMPYFVLLLLSDMTPSWQLWFDVTRITIFIYCAITIIPTPGNSGAADGTFYGLFSRILTVAGTCFTGMMIWRLFSFYSYILLGLVVLIVTKIVAQVRARRNRLNLDKK